MSAGRILIVIFIVTTVMALGLSVVTRKPYQDDAPPLLSAEAVPPAKVLPKATASPTTISPVVAPPRLPDTDGPLLPYMRSFDGVSGSRDCAALELPVESRDLTVRDMAAGVDGRLFLAMAAPPTTLLDLETAASGRVESYDADGKAAAGWPVEWFVPQAIAVTADGIIFVAGQGRMAVYTETGKLLRYLERFGVRQRELAEDVASEVGSAFRGAMLESCDRKIRECDLEVSRLSRQVSEDRARQNETLALLAEARELRGQAAKYRDDFRSWPLDRWKRACIEYETRVNGIAVADDVLFVAVGRDVLRMGVADAVPDRLNLPRLAIRSLHPAADGFAVFSEGKVARYDRNARLLDENDLWAALSPDENREYDDRIFSIGAVDVDRRILADWTGRVTVHDTAGTTMAILRGAVPEANRSAFPAAPIVEVAPDRKRIYLWLEGARRIARFDCFPSAY